ncbi:glycosyltransferase family 2 protein [Pseudoalteromonas atlantica]|uniref:glycosyltransferase family 2 protein n=1 Tax=Pseudoalteromonas atlantica TaxID=288 RepID=UPI003735B59F
MCKIIIGIVSHGHYNYISNNEELKKIAEINDVKILIKDNIQDNKLKLYSEENGFHYIITSETLGFGENNNYIYEFAKSNFSVSSDDWFIILNPDVEISKVEFVKLISELKSNAGSFFAPNLFKDNNFTQTENSIRMFASYFDLLNPLKLQPINKAYNKKQLTEKEVVEWASGAFLCITFGAFGSVDGFDHKYFMYYEDVDLCYRLNQKGIKLQFLKNIKAVHKGEYKNRSVFSKHFRWYLSSLFKFLKTQSQYGIKSD